MRTFLSHDARTRHLTLVMTDYYNGQHERTEFTVVNPDDEPIRNRPELDGLRVHGNYARMPATGTEVLIRTMPGQQSDTQRTECPRATNRRRKCNLCAMDAV